MLKFFQNFSNTKIQIKYSVNDFIFRYKKIEKITVKEGLDGFLLINGSDGKDNLEYTKLTSWLFLGTSGVEIEENEFLQQQFSEMIVLIKKGSARVYIEKQGLEQIQHLLYSIPNVQVFCPTDSQFDNKDELEIIKFTEFCQMVQGLKKVGVLLGQKDLEQIKNIEKWPLIQTYGISEFGNGFFSLTHEPVDLTKRINQVYKNHDKFSIQKLIQDTSYKIAGHFNSSVGIMGDQKIHKRGQVTELQVSEMMKDTYELEELNPHAKMREDKTLPTPRVLFGKNTSNPTGYLPSDVQLKNCSYNDKFEAFHLTAESSDLHYKIRVARTYFLRKNVKLETHVVNINDDQDVVQQYKLEYQENENYLDETFLVDLYNNLVIAFQEVISQFSKDYKNLTADFVQQYVFTKLSPCYSEHQKQQPLEQKQIQVTLRCYNAYGEEGKIDFKDTISFKLPHYIYILKVEIAGIQSALYPGTSLGSVILCDTFILQENCYILLTKDVPYLDLWNAQNTFSEKIQNLKQRITLEELGKQLQAWDFFYEKNRVFIPTDKLSYYGIDIPILTMKYVLHEKGLRMGDDKIGWIMILFSQMQNIRICKNLPTNWIVFTMEQNILFSSMNKQILCLEFVGRAVEEVYLKIIKYLDENKIPYNYFSDTPSIITESAVAQREILKLQVSPKQIRHNQILNSQIFLNFLEDKQLMILNQLKDLKLAQYFQMYDNIAKNNENVVVENKIGLIFVNGSYAAGKNKFAQSLKRYGQENNLRVHVMRFNYSHMAILDIKNYLQSTISFVKDNKVQQGDIIISVIPYFISTFTLLEYFQKNEKLSNIFYIRTIVTKVNVNNFYKNENRSIVDNVTSYGIPGYSQLLLLDGYDNYEADVENLRKLLKTIRPEQQIYRLTNNIVYPDVAKEILTQNKFTNEMNQFTRQKLSVFYDITIPLDYKLLFIRFTTPISQKKIEKFLHQTIMRERQGYVYDEKERVRIVAEYKNQYKDSTDELITEIIKAKDKLERLNFESKPDTMKLDYIKGITRFDNQLQEGLFEITVTSNYIIDRKVRNIDVKMKEETINGKVYKRPVYGGFADLEDVGFLFAGRNLSEAKLRALLEDIILDKPARKLAKTKEQLTKEETEQIEYENASYGLENGEFYDGYRFRDLNGMMLPHHPKLDEIIAKKLVEEQKQLDEQYSQAEAQFQAHIKVISEFLCQ